MTKNIGAARARAIAQAGDANVASHGSRAHRRGYAVGGMWNGMPGVTPASAKSAWAVRRFNMNARNQAAKEAAGFSIGGCGFSVGYQGLAGRLRY